MSHQRPEGQHPTRPFGVPGFYLVAVMSMLVSVDTSWRFFEHNLHITDIRERVVMFAVLEVAMVACGYGMRANVRAHGRPGAPRLVAWVLCAMAGYMAWQLSGIAEGVARVVLGPVLGLVMLHLALGIEIRAGHTRSTTGARVAHELRERVLSRLGLADDTRDALARTRDRAVQRAARLALAGRLVPARKARLVRALRTARVADDPGARARLLAELAVGRHAGELAGLALESPWRPVAPPAAAAGTRRSTRSGTGRQNRASTGTRRAPAKPGTDTPAVPVPAASTSISTEPSTDLGTDTPATPVPAASTHLHVVSPPAGTDVSTPEQQHPWTPEQYSTALRIAREYRAANGTNVTIDGIRKALGIGRNPAAVLTRAVLASGDVSTEASTGTDRATQ